MFRRESTCAWRRERRQLGERWVPTGSRKVLFKIPGSAFQPMIREQMSNAVAIGTDTRGRRRWMYKDEFFVDDEGLGPDDATALAEADRDGDAAPTTRLPSGTRRRNGRGRTAIAREVKHAVWQARQRQLRRCGASRDLQFDHIMPVAKAATTHTNLRLLCVRCNRCKGATLGCSSGPGFREPAQRLDRRTIRGCNFTAASAT